MRFRFCKIKNRRLRTEFYNLVANESINKKIILFFGTGYFIPPLPDAFNKYIIPIGIGRLKCKCVFHDSLF
jgi:hypothetical protein